MTSKPVFIILTLLSLKLFSASVLANTSSVFSPDVKAGDQSFEYRTSHVPDEGTAESVFAQRLHVQHAFNDSWRIRIMGSMDGRGGGAQTYNYTRLELQHQYLENERDGWDAAIRYELQISDRTGRPDRLRLGWTGKWDLNEEWQLRANLMLGRQINENAGSGVFVETRGQVTRRFGEARLGLEMFNDMNQTTDFGSFDDQEHQLGPIFKFKLSKLSVNVSYLFGISDGAPDDNFRVHLIHPL